MIRAVLIDLDDTLVDHRHPHRTALTSVWNLFPALQAVSVDALLVESTRVLTQLHDDVQLGRVSVDDARVERYRRLFAFAGVEGEAPSAEAARMSRVFYHANRRCVPGAKELLAELALHARIAVVTNNTTAEQTEKLRAFDLACHVDALVTSEAVGAAKPDPRIYAVALAKLDVLAIETVMVGDSLAADVAGARAAGLHACWLDREGVARGDEPFIVLNSLAPARDVAARILGH
jgi:HAD superfamily hydrolase (TIGR01549 family)